MPRHDGKHATINAAGEITEIFAHRFVLKTLSRNVLADLTPHGLEIVTLRVGDKVSIEGEQKPSEIKVSKLERNGETFEIAHGPRDKHAHAPADAVVVIEAAKSAGYRVIGEARRKPKHFEVLGKKGHAFQELHIELGGGIRRTKLVSPDDHKWQLEIDSAK